MPVIPPELPSSETVLQAAIAMEPVDLPVDYGAIPDNPPRSEKLAARIATNIGPLFGVPYPNGPFGEQSWLSLYSELTLDEIARGAPKPPRSVMNEMEAAGLIDSSGRIISAAAEDAPPYIPYQAYIYGKTPNTIVAPSLYTFCPDAKAGVVLEGVNYLFRAQSRLLAEATQNPLFQNLTPAERIKTYGAMIFGVYRPQPLLFLAGRTAAVLQKNALPLDIPLAPHLRDAPRARSEIGGPRKDPAPHQPLILDVIEASITPLAQSLREEGHYFPGFDIKGLLLRGLTTTLQDTRLQETYTPETKQSTARAMDNPGSIAEALLNATPHRAG